MKASNALATTAVLLMLGMRTVESSWGRLGGFDRFGHRYPTIDRDWSGTAGSRRIGYPQQYTGWPRQQASHDRRDSSAQMQMTQTGAPQTPPPPLSSSMFQPDPNDDFTATFLNFAGEDVVLSSLELSDLLHAATGDGTPPASRSVLQILQTWDSNRDGGLNLSEFMRMYAELQRQMPSTFQQHWGNLRRGFDETAPENTAPTEGRQPRSQESHESELPLSSPSGNTYATPDPMKKVDTDAPFNGSIRPRKGRLNYIEKGERFFDLVFDDEDGPLTVKTIVSTRIVGDVDSWAESDVW